jgi:iodothyronine deiodinase-like protein
MQRIVIAILIGLIPSGAALADDAAAATQPAQALSATRPIGPGRRGMAGGAAIYIQDIRESLARLDLSGEQRSRVNALFSDFEATAIEIRRKAIEGGAAPRPQILAAMQDFRAKLSDILTPAQMEQFRQLMVEQLTDAPPRREPPQTRPVKANSEKSAGVASGGVGPGADAPAFDVLSPQGVEINSERFQGRVLVLEFGSISAPSFRDHVAEFQKLAGRYAGRAAFLVIYTREQHPEGGWDSQRNQDDGISVDQPADISARLSRANEARSSLGITLPMGVDGMDDAASKAYGGFPNAAVVIGRDGKIVGKQQWTDPSGLGRLIDLALAGK